MYEQMQKIKEQRRKYDELQRKQQESTTYISDNDDFSLYIPEGFAHGFLTCFKLLL